MPVLTRKPGEAINIGSDVTVTIVAVSGSQVRVGINAPSEVPVHREEIFRRSMAVQENWECRGG